MSISLEPGKIFNKVDDRGTFHHFHPPFEVKRMYFVSDFSTKTIRAFHMHRKERKAFYCVNGAVLVVTMPAEQSGFANTEKAFKFTLTPDSQPLVVETGHYVGFRTLVPGTLYLAMSDRVFDPTDDFRLDPNGVKFRELFEVQNR